jgi:hypothetical protein
MDATARGRVYAAALTNGSPKNGATASVSRAALMPAAAPQPGAPARRPVVNRPGALMLD